MNKSGYKQTALGLIPEEWEVKRLDNVSVIKGEYGINAPAVDYSEKLPTYLRITDIGEGGEFLYNQKKSVAHPDADRYLLENGDIVFARTGATVGKTYLHNREKDGKLVFAGFLIRFRCDEKELLPYYLKSFTATKSYWDWVKMVSMRSGQPGINGTEYGSLEIPLPPLPEQRKIAAILSTWDKAIEREAALIAALQTRHRALMQRLLTGKVRLKGFEGEWKRESYGNILMEVRRPVEWNDAELYNLISVRRRSGGIFAREALFGHQIKVKDLRIAKTGDFLFSKMQIVHGASALVSEEFNGAKISGSYIAVAAKDARQLDMGFFNWYSHLPYFYHQAYVSSYGVHIEKMTFDFDSFLSLEMKLPSLAEQSAIAAILSTSQNEITLHRSRLAALQEQKKGLMQQLLTGKKRVTI